MSKILIADDVLENRYYLTSLFVGNGHQVVAAENGADALAKAQESPPDLIVTDILMPVMDGFELCRRWKTDEHLRAIPFIFYTATYTDPKDERFALSLGADRFLVKPQKPEQLMGVVREVLEEARSRQRATSASPLGDEMEVLRQYNEVLFRKLEKRVTQLQAEIAERERAQEALKESQAELLEAQRLAHIGTWNWDRETDEVVWSPELYRIAGIDPHQPAPSYLEQQRIYSPESWKRLDAAVAEALQTGKPYGLELELIRSDGTRRWIHALGEPRQDARGRVVRLHGTVQDVTDRKRAEDERRRLEERLRASQKLEAMGRLAGGVAHDFNNLLSVILGCSNLALGGLPESDPLRDDLLEIAKAGERAAALTRQLLAFGRKQVLQPVPLSLNRIAAELETMFRRVLGADIDLAQTLAPDLGLALADPCQMEQVLTNLVINARDAMPQGGILTIETANVGIDEEYAAQHEGVAPGPHVMIAVTDTGAGMDQQTIARIFEPFFTTKGFGKGTGLGLSTVHGIVKQSGGSISVYSEPGRGTTFKVYLPRAFSDGTATAATPPAFSRPVKGTETILVVEDEEALRKIAHRVLAAAGYTVLTAADGDEAMRIAAEHRGDIHLLLTDMSMPRMGGRALARELAMARPTLAVLYMSGYSDNAVLHGGVLEAGTHFVSKPFTGADLTWKVREVLDGGAADPAGRHAPAVETDARAEAQRLDKAALRPLPPDVVSRLRRAVVSARYDEMVEIIESVRPASPKVADGLRGLVDSFDYVELLGLLER